MVLKRNILIKGFSILVIGLLFYIVLFLKVQNLELLLNPKQLTPLSPLYYPKQIHEGVQSLFFFGDQDQAFWYLTLSEKRINEAQILKSHGFNELAKNQIQTAQELQQKAYTKIEILKGKTDVNYLLEKYSLNQTLIEQN